MQRSTSVSTPFAAPKKQNWTLRIIFFLIIVALIITGITYFIVLKNKSSMQNPSPTIKQKIINAEEAQWEKFTDDKRQYSFYYPDTWTLTKSTADQSEFEFKYDDVKKPGVIKGKFLSKDERSKTGEFSCEKNPEQKANCRTYTITSSTNAFIDLTFEDNIPTKVDALITRPNNEAILINITQPNFDSYQTLAIMIDTLSFKGEKRVNKLQVCPDSWSIDRDTAVYRGITFQSSDIDLDFVKTDCK